MKIRDLVNAHIRDLAPYVPGKPVDELERELGLEGSIKLASNESPLGPSRRVIEAIFAAAEELNRYPDDSCFHLRAALATKLGVGGDSICFAAGSDGILELLAKCFLGPGDDALFPWPSFAMYPIATQGVGANAVRVPLDSELRADVEGDACRADAAHANPVPRQSEQPDRHSARRGRVRGAPEGAAGTRGAGGRRGVHRVRPPRRLPRQHRGAARAQNAGGAAHLLEGLRVGGSARRLRRRESRAAARTSSARATRSSSATSRRSRPARRSPTPSTSTGSAASRTRGSLNSRRVFPNSVSASRAATPTSCASRSGPERTP